MDGQQYQQSVFLTQPTDAAQHKIRKRNRLPLSCLLCRIRKVKCDRQRPCERCVKSGRAAFCDYSSQSACKPRSDRQPSFDIRPSHKAKSRPALQARLQKLEETMRGMVAHNNHPRDNALNVPLSPNRHTDSQSRSNLSTPPSIIGGCHTSILPVQSKSTFVSPTDSSAIFESISELRSLVEARTEEAFSPSPPASHPHETDVVFGPQPGITIEQAIARLPPKNKMDQLVLMHFQHPFTAAPCIHALKFQKDYDSFWEDPSSASLLWVSILSSILWSAAFLARSKSENSRKDCDAAYEDNLAKLSVECLVAGDYMAARPYSIEALLLHVSTDLQKNRHSSPRLWAKVELLIRLAQRMSYHRDPKHLPSVSLFEEELRRRAWFFIEMFDCIVSFQLGMSPSIREDECDTESPGNPHNLDFEDNRIELPPPRPQTKPASTFYLCIKSKLCRKLRRVIKISVSIPPTPYEEVMKLHDEIERCHDYLPQSLKVRPIRACSFTDQTQDIISQLTLEMMYLKSLCVLHRKYLNSEESDFRYEPSRRTSVNAAIRILDLHARYEEECRPGGRLFGDRYVLASLSLHDVLIAAIILYLDLSENAPSSQEDRARKLKVLGTSYQIWSENEIICKEANYATKVLGAIIHKISMQVSPRESLPPLQPQVRSGSLHMPNLLNNDNQLPPLSAIMPSYRSQLSNVMDHSLGISDSVSLDQVINDIGRHDWTMIDRMMIL